MYLCHFRHGREPSSTGHIEVASQRTKTASIGGQLLGRNASKRERAPGDVRLGRSIVAMMIWE
jgi:hypothetical protein